MQRIDKMGEPDRLYHQVLADVAQIFLNTRSNMTNDDGISPFFGFGFQESSRSRGWPGGKGQYSLGEFIPTAQKQELSQEGFVAGTYDKIFHQSGQVVLREINFQSIHLEKSQSGVRRRSFIPIDEGMVSNQRGKIGGRQRKHVGGVIVGIHVLR